MPAGDSSSASVLRPAARYPTGVIKKYAWNGSSGGGGKAVQSVSKFWGNRVPALSTIKMPTLVLLPPFAVSA